MNIDIKADAAWTSVLQPFPKTEIAAYVLEEGLMDHLDIEGLSADAHTASPLRQSEIREIVNLHKFVHVLVRFPILEPLVRLLIKLPPNPLYNLIYKVSYFYFFYIKIRRATGWRMLQEMIMALRYTS